MFTGYQPQVGADAAAGESGPVTDFYRQTEPSGHSYASHTHLSIDRLRILARRGDLCDPLIQTVQMRGQ